MDFSMTWVRLLAVAASLAALAGSSCSSSGDDEPFPESRGELGFATFEYVCLTTSDARCEAVRFPRFLANGGEFDATVYLDSRLPDAVSSRGIEPASPNLITEELGILTARRPGVVALLALGNDNSIIDYINVYVLDVDRLAIRATSNQPSCDPFDCEDVVGSAGTFVLVPGQNLRVAPLPFGYGELLAGSLTYSWEALDPEILGVQEENGGTALLQPQQVGEARINVTTGNLTETIVLHVTEAPPPPATDDGTTGGTDGGTDPTGSGSDGSGSGSDGSGSGSGSDGGSGSSSGGSTTGGM
jgi:uncharacterized membrane protein YgcG